MIPDEKRDPSPGGDRDKSRNYNYDRLYDRTLQELRNEYNGFNNTHSIITVPNEHIQRLEYIQNI